MPKRLLDCCASDFRSFSKNDLLESIQKSEGRVIACETIGTVLPLLGNVTNAEFAASMGADILLLNMFDVQHPVIRGLPETEPENVVRMLKKMTGRPIGINLEPVAEGEEGETDPIWKMAVVPPSKTPCEPKSWASTSSCSPATPAWACPTRLSSRRCANLRRPWGTASCWRQAKCTPPAC